MIEYVLPCGRSPILKCCPQAFYLCESSSRNAGWQWQTFFNNNYVHVIIHCLCISSLKK